MSVSTGDMDGPRALLAEAGLCYTQAKVELRCSAPAPENPKIMQMDNNFKCKSAAASFGSGGERSLSRGWQEFAERWSKLRFVYFV